MQRLTAPLAILIGCIVIALAILGAQFVPRYQVAPIPGGTGAWRIDTRTGELRDCYMETDGAGALSAVCHPTVRAVAPKE